MWWLPNSTNAEWLLQLGMKEKKRNFNICLKKMKPQNLSRIVGNTEHLTKTEQKQDGVQVSFIKVL